MVLDEVCRQLPNGGDHELRKRIAEQLLKLRKPVSAELRAVGLRTFAEAFKWTGPGRVADEVLMASVLLVEDEALIRMMIADMIVELGHKIAGEAGDLQTGVALASEAEIDIAS